MAKLTKKKINQLLSLIRDIIEYKYDLFDRWEDFIILHGMFLLRAEVILAIRLCEEAGINLPNFEIPPIDSFDDYETYDMMYDLNQVISELLYPSNDFMIERGWIEEVHFIDYESINDNVEKIKGNNDLIFKENLIKETFGEYGNRLPKLADILHDVYNDIYTPDIVCTIKSQRAGAFIEYAEKNPKIKETKLYHNIEECIGLITRPYYVIYPMYCEKVVEDGCLYACYTTGSINESGEFLDLAHAIPFRLLCIEILDNLLKEAEKKYGYLEKASLKSA